jgi:transcriptional regulator with PAS, ATPase and Fis domain
LATGRVLDWPKGTTAEVHYKVCDAGCYWLEDANGKRLKRENETLKANLSEKYSFKNIVAQSESFKEVFETIKRLSPYNTTVMITGESGTGKELLARAIHESSPRRWKPFIAINC